MRLLLASLKEPVMVDSVIPCVTQARRGLEFKRQP
jgi:hypothetical protein